MNELVHADIFFFISSIATVVLTAGFCVLLYFLIPIARDARDLLAMFHTAAEEIELDFEKFRHAAEEEGHKSKMLIDLLLGFVGHFFYTPPRRRRKRARPSAP